MIEQLGGRKFIFAILMTVAGFVLTVMGLVVAQNFLDFMIAVGGIYVVGNVGSTVAHNMEKNP